MNSDRDDEQTRVSKLRALVERQDPSSKDVDDLTLRRFLRARELNVEKASAMFLKYLKWRKTFVPLGYIPHSDIPNYISQDEFFAQGFDKEGRPIAVAFGGRHFKTRGSTEEYKRFLVSTLDKLCARVPPGQEKFLIIVDLKGFGYANSDIHGYLGLVGLLQDYYPERLGKAFMVHAPFVFMQTWKLIYPFVDKNTRKKIFFLEVKKLRSTLLEHIDESQLPEIYGGKLPLVSVISLPANADSSLK